MGDAATEVTRDRHRTACQKIAADRGWDIIDEYVDQSISATDKSKKRPAYDRMVADYKAGLIDAILCWDLDRLTRQPRELEDWVDAAKDRGLKLVTANGEADLTTDGGRMFARVKAAVAAGEVERKAARQSLAQAQRARQGRAPKGTRPLGYTTDGDVVEHEAAAVRKIYELFAVPDGVTIAALAAGLSGKTGDHIPKGLPVLPSHTRTLMIERNQRREAEGLKLKEVPDDKPWTSSTVLGILRNPRYAGYSTYTPKTLPPKDPDDPNGSKRRSWRASILRDEQNEPVMGLWEPVVPEQLWWAVQARLDEPVRITNKLGNVQRKHLGSGLFMCGICDGPVRSHSTRYRCAGHVMRSREQIDDWVLRIIRERLSRPDLRDVMPDQDDPRIAEIDEQIAQHKGKVKRAESDYDAEIIEGFDLKRIRDRENARIDALEAERRKLTATVGLSPVLDAKDPVRAFEDADLAIKRRVIDFFVEVRLYPHPRGRKTFDPETVKVTPKTRR
ncbi:recombinase family protein [Streptomyces malaysiensis]|uniref:recombinase family protein n=1 Tax=Streptomyces malaysiensis TaxID=92644 RepID=UPI002B30A7A9|nr:recombinase family protein [Streptomyces malaysiensis]